MNFRSGIARTQERIAAGLKALASLPIGAYGTGYGGEGGGLSGALSAIFGGTLPGASFPYRQSAGDLWSNTIVLASHKWQARQFPASPCVIERKGEGGKYAALPGHELLDLLDTPNEDDDGTLIWQALLLSLMVDGNGYWYCIRSEGLKLAGFQYIPHFQIAPYWHAGSKRAVDGYAYRVDGRMMLLPRGDVIHFRDGKDPRNPRLGLSSLGATVREVCTDNEAAGFAASLLRNMGVAGVIISPKEGTVEGMTPTQQEAYKRRWRDATRGEKRGEPLVFDNAIDLNRLAWSPSEIDMRAIRSIPEERITACTGIPAVVVGLGTGLAAAGDRNLEAMERWAWDHNILPTQRILAAQLTKRMGPASGRNPDGEGLLKAGERVAFDTSKVRVLTVDDTAKYVRTTQAVGGAWLTRNEARISFGLDAIEGGDVLYPPKASQPPPIAPQA